MSACRRASGRARSRSGWSPSRSGCSAPPRRRTSRSGRCTARTAAGSATSGSARSTARRSPTATSPRATSCRTARWSCWTTTTSPTCRSPRRASVEVLSFVPAEQIDAVQMGKPYYCDPTGDVKPYVLLRDSLEKADRVAVVKVALRQRERLAMLRAREGVLVLQTLLWPDEVRAPEARLPRRRRHGAPAGAGDGRVLHQRAVRRLRARGVLRPLPRGARGGHRGQGRRPRGRRPRRGARRRPGRSST